MVLKGNSVVKAAEGSQDGRGCILALPCVDQHCDLCILSGTGYQGII